MANDVPHNQIWVDGVEIDIISGDVSALEESLDLAIKQGGAWVRFEQPGHHYSIYAGPNTGVVAHYID